MLLMLAVTAVWGLTFVTVKVAIAAYPPAAFLAARFVLAAVLLGVFALARPRDARLGLLIGAILAAGYAAQTYGLVSVPPSTAGLLTGMFVVFTPVCDALVFGKRTPVVTWVAILLSLAGLVALTYDGRFDSGTLAGESLVLACAILFAVHISLLSRYSRHHSPLSLAGWQLVACAALFLLVAGATREAEPPPGAVWPALVLTGVVASALAFLAQTYVQRHLSAGRAALLLTAEPAFAVVFGVTLAHDRLTPLKAAGALLILLALAGHEALGFGAPG